jgi:Anticodon binding domain
MERGAELRESSEETARSSFSAADAEAIAIRRGWLSATTGGTDVATGATEGREAGPGIGGWLAEAAQLLGAQSSTPPAFERLLECVFLYDASQLLARKENQAVLSREGARDVLRELAVRVLEAQSIDSDRFKEIVAALKETTGRRGPELFHPVRLALAGCAGEGEYDRVILLLDGASRLEWAGPVKSCRKRILEFCAAID